MMRELFERVLEQARAKRLLSAEHFSGDGMPYLRLSLLQELRT